MRRTALRFALAALLAREAGAQGTPISGNRLEVIARLDNDGRLEVAETHEIKVQGDALVIDRDFNYAADQSIVVHGVYRLEADGSRIALRDAPVEEANAYQAYRWGIRFSLKGAKDPAIAGVETRRYVIEYALQGALNPAWDMAAGPLPLDAGTMPRHPLERLKEVWAGWRQAAPEVGRLYRLDHDVVFPSRGSSEGLAELNYRLEYDSAWVLLDKDRDIGIATPDVDYRVQRVLRYLPEGRPRAVNPTGAALRIAGLAAPLFVGLAFGLFFIATDRLSQPSPKGDRALFESRVAPLPKELIQEQLGGSAYPPSLEIVLLRLAAQRKLTISVESQATDDLDAVVRLRLGTDRGRLTPFEREVVQEMFGSADTLSTTDLQDRFAKRGFDPERVVDAAYRRASGPPLPKKAPKGRPLWSAFHLTMMAGGVALLVKSLTSQTMADPAPLFAGLVPGNLMVGVWPVGASTRRPGFLALLLGIVALGLLGAILALTPNTPLSGDAALGLAVLSTGHVIGLIARQRRPSPIGLELDAARNWAVTELRKPRPDLRDAWVEALEGLGAQAALARWKARHAGVMGGGDMSEAGQNVLPVGPPFTGESPRFPTLPDGWIDGFFVGSGDEEEVDEEEEEDGAR